MFFVHLGVLTNLMCHWHHCQCHHLCEGTVPFHEASPCCPLLQLHRTGSHLVDIKEIYQYFNLQVSLKKHF